MTKFLNRFIEDTSGATAVEYGIIGALLGVAAIAGGTVFTNSVEGMFNHINTSMEDANPT